jgi:hypothetical protein
MANLVYDKARTEILTNGLTGKTLKVALIDTGAYTVDQAAHQFVSDIPGAAIIARSGALANITLGVLATGTLDADDPTIAAVTGNTVEAYVVYEDTGVDGTSKLLCYVDESDGAVPISFTPNGSDVVVTFSASGILDI